MIDEYDDRDLIIRKTDYLKVAREISYNSFQDRIGEIHDAGGLNISNQWTVDSMSRVTSYVDPTSQISHYHWDSLGRNYKIDYPNGFSVTRKFNNLGQIVEETSAAGVKFEYGFDAQTV